MIRHSTITTLGRLKEAIVNLKDIIICSDGTLKDHLSGGAYIIAICNEEILATGYNSNTGHKIFQTSYCSQVQAGYAALLFL